MINPWSRIPEPSQGIPKVYGSYWAGCLEGAVSLPPDGEGYQMMRLSRDRFWAHPALRNFLFSFASALKGRGLGPILIGDLGQPRGGPTLSGHSSHQTGLDADIWFWHPAAAESRSLSLDERELLDAPSVVLPGGVDLDPGFWSADKAEILRVAAGFEEVQRIFVNPAIKKGLCQSVQGDRAWLAKIRPWSGHDSHFHVRLRCPGEDGGCKAQTPPALEEGCGAELDEWFKPKPPEKPKEPRMPDLPPECLELLKKDSAS